MDALHRRDHAELPEARDVGQTEMLRVLDAPTPVLHRRIRLEGGLEDVERLAVGTIADGVHTELHAVGGGDGRQLLHLGHWRRVEAAAAGRVAVGREHPGAARAERAVEGLLDGRDGEVVVVQAHRLVGGQLRLDVLVAVAHHDPQADAERALGSGLLQHVDGGEVLTGVLERRDALLQRGLDRQRDLTARVGGAFRGRLLRHPRGQRVFGQVGRGLAQHADGSAARVFEDLAARRVLAGRRDAGGLHGLRVHVDGVPAGVLEKHRIVRRYLAERVVNRKALDVGLGHRRPLLLMPAASANPLARFRVGGGVGHQRHDLAPARRRHQVDHHARLTEAHEVAVAFDEARHGREPTQIDDLSGGADEWLHVGGGAHGHDAITAHRQRPHFGQRRIHRDDLAVARHHRRRFHRGRARACGQDRQRRGHRRQTL